MTCNKLTLGKVLFGTIHAFMLFVLVAPVALAADNGGAAEGGDESSWTMTVGGGVAVAPEFEGSNKYNTRFVPVVEIEIMNRVFLSTIRGLGVYVIDHPNWNLNVSATYDLGRKEKDSDLLKGMGDIDGGVVFDIYGAWTPGPFTVSLETKYGTGDVQGLNVTGGFGYTMEPLTGLHWTNTVSTTFADSRYNNTFFGISQKQSRQSRQGYDYYDASAGIKDVAFTSSLTYEITDSIAIMLEGEHKRLIGPAARSPLVKAGSKDQFSGVFGVTYTF